MVRLHPAPGSGAGISAAVDRVSDTGVDGHRDRSQLPCQRPFSEHLGIAELPQYRILPDHKQTAASSNLWQSSSTGGPFLFTQALLRTSTIATYLRGDWYRDWGSVEQYHRLVPADQAPDAVVEEGVITVPGWGRPGPIRALP